MKYGKGNIVKFFAVIVFVLVVGAFAAPRVPGLPENMQNWLDKFKINLGLDLQGGLHLEYKMDLDKISPEQRKDAIDAVQSVIERRVNALGVAESVVQIAHRGDDRFLIVELPGIKDAQKAKDIIKETPFLEFKEERTEEEIKKILEEKNKAFEDINKTKHKEAQEKLEQILRGDKTFEEVFEEYKPKDAPEDYGILEIEEGSEGLPESISNVVFSDELKDGEIYKNLVDFDLGWLILKKEETKTSDDGKRKVRIKYITFNKIQLPPTIDDRYKPTELTGKYLEGAMVTFSGSGVSSPAVSLQFDDEGKKIFADLTKRNLNKTIAIYIDDELVTAPVVKTVITDGRAEITGDYTLDEAKKLEKRLNEGALPVPIELVSQQSVGATVGMDALTKSIKAGAIGLMFIVFYMILYYRIFGLVAGFAIVVYAATIISIFKLSSSLGGGFGITLTLAGFAGLILSIGMAVDANVLIFERIREELRRGVGLRMAIDEGFRRAWSAILDGNLSTIITAMILTTMGTGFVKGFAVILILGVLVSMFTAVVLVRVIIHFIAGKWLEDNLWLICNCSKKK